MSNDKLTEIQGANLPDVKFNLTANVPMSFVQMLTNQVQLVMQGKMKAKDYYLALDKMENAIEFFRNVVVTGGEYEVGEDREYRGK